MSDSIAGLYIMPSEGTVWRAMREGHVSMTGGVSRSTELCHIILSALAPEPNNRPTTQIILNNPAVKEAGSKDDKILLSAPDIIVQDDRIFRTSSFKSSGSFKLSTDKL